MTALYSWTFPKDDHKKRCELLRISNSVSDWTSDWAIGRYKWIIHAHFWLDISRSLQVSLSMNLTSAENNEGTIKYKVKFAEMVVSYYIKTHPSRYGYLFTCTKWKQLNRDSCCMVTISNRNDKYLAMKVSHVLKYDVNWSLDGAPQPIKLQFNF